MATDTWTRQHLAPSSWSVAKKSWLLASLTAGQTLTRTRFAWWFVGVTSQNVTLANVFGVPMSMGLVTTIGPAGSDVPPDPINQSADQAPPAQRWLWLEDRWPTVAAWCALGSVIAWESSPPQEPCDSHAQVKAPVMAMGSTLNVWLVYRSSASWDTTGAAEVAAYANLLVRSP